MRALILSAPTLDELEFVAKGVSSRAPGGPGLFAGLAFKRLGYEVCSVGPYGPKVESVVRFELSLGLKRVCCSAQGEGFVIHHTFPPSGPRRTKITSGAARLLPSQVIEALEVCDPEVVLVSPNYDEVPLEALQALRDIGRVALDVQGYARSMGEGWWEHIPREVARLVHMSDDDGPYTIARELSTKFEALLYTVGLGGAVAFVRGSPTAMPSRGPELEDRTGSGDVITALTSHHFLVRGLPLEDAYLESLDVFIDVIKEALSLRRAFIG